MRCACCLAGYISEEADSPYSETPKVTIASDAARSGESISSHAGFSLPKSSRSRTLSFTITPGDSGPVRLATPVHRPASTVTSFGRSVKICNCERFQRRPRQKQWP